MSNPATTELLRACLTDDGANELSLRRWESLQAWEDLDDASLRLIPYLYRVLERSGMESRHHHRIKGTYARYWYLHHRDVIPGLDALLSAPVHVGEPLILKGLALQVLVYGCDPPTRPVKDVDILVSSRDVRSWVDRLESTHFVAESPYSLSYAMRYRKSAGYRLGTSSVDLNWRVHEFSADHEVETRMLRRRTHLRIAGRDMVTFSITDHLLHTLLHGSAWNPVSPTRWILDASLLIRSGEVDWEIFIDEVHRCGWRSPILEMLQYLRDVFDVEVPTDAVRSLRVRSSHLPGLAAHFALTRHSRWSRRACRVLYAEAMNQRPRARSRLGSVLTPAVTWGRMAEEFTIARRRPAE